VAPSTGTLEAAPVGEVARPDPMSEASIVADLTWLVAPERKGRGSLSPEAVATAAWLADELRAAGYAPELQAIPDAPGQSNVIAIRRATREGAPTVMVTAHYDHLGEIDGVVYPGADDNASGVALALAVARDLAVTGDDVPGQVVFVFTGAEELGLYGATAYAAAPAVPLDKVTLVINLDLVGRRLFSSAIDKDAALGVIGLEGDVATIAEDAAGVAGLELMTASPRMVRWIGQDFRTDDWIFRDLGVPAIHLSTGLHDDYHQPTDTLDKLSRPQLVRVAAFVRELVRRVAR